MQPQKQEGEGRRKGGEIGLKREKNREGGTFLLAISLVRFMREVGRREEKESWRRRTEEERWTTIVRVLSRLKIKKTHILYALSLKTMHTLCAL